MTELTGCHNVACRFKGVRIAGPIASHYCSFRVITIGKDGKCLKFEPIKDKE